MSDLSNLSRPEGAHRDRKRIGRGPGSGTGKTSGKGHKGQKARTGHHGIPSWFEGGQMPLQRRVPKRGFKNPFRTEYEIVNLGQLNKLSEEEITPEVLHSNRLVDIGKGRPVKVLGDGEITRKITVRAHKVSESARAKIEAAGGSVEILEA
jgi:large subunit ribosomal protein L15